MTCYRKGGCGPYEMYPCCECPASHPEYLTHGEPELMKVEVAPVKEVIPQLISKDRAIEIVKEKLADHPPLDYVKLCPKCGRVAFWSSYFRGWKCIVCEHIIRPDVTNDSRLHDIITAIEQEPGLPGE